MPKVAIRHAPLTAHQQALVQSCVPMAFRLAGDMAKKAPMAVDRVGGVGDLAGEAVVALCRMAKHYDPSRGIKFSTPAYLAAQRAIWAAMGRKDNRVAVAPPQLENEDDILDHRGGGGLDFDEREALEAALKS